MKKIFLALTILALIFVITGCDDKEIKDSEYEGTLESEENGIEADSETEDGGIFSLGKKSAKEALTDLIGDYKKIEYKVTYDVKSDTAKDSIMKQYIKGEDMRNDITTEEVEVRTYILNKAVYMCNQDSGSWSCMKFDTLTDEEEEFKEGDFMENPDKYDINYLGTRKIIGKSVSCYEISHKNEAMELQHEHCYTSKGIPLYFKMIMKHTEMGTESFSEMTATSFSDSVSRADLTLPAEATEINLPSMGDIGSDPCAVCEMIPDKEAKEECLKSC